jgi:WD40 repeat protein
MSCLGNDVHHYTFLVTFNLHYPMPPPPTPFHILRAHQAPLSAIRFTAGNTHLVAGDQDGTVSITDLRARRVIASWKAHDGGILGLGEWDGGIVTCVHSPAVAD